MSYSIWGCEELDTTEQLTLMNITNFLTNRELKKKNFLKMSFVLRL